MSRRRDLEAIRLGFDLANPPAGQRLVFAVVAARLGVTVTQMSQAAAISRTAVADLMNNRWPARTPAEQIRGAIAELLEHSGATDDEITTLWHAYVPHKQGPQPALLSDAQGRALPRRPARLAQQPPPTIEDTDMLLPKQALSPAAKRHFKLFRNPFDGEVVSDEMMFSGDDFAYVREAAWQCSQTGGFVAVVGESGAGKTTVLVDLEARLEREGRGVILIKPSVLGMEESDNTGKTLKSTDILHAIITQLDAQHSVPQTLQARTVRALKLLAASAQAGNTHLLVVDEAHSMPDATLKHLKRLHELRDGRRPLLGILLLGQPELKLRLAEGLASGLLREVAQRCEVVELLPLDADLAAYLGCRAAASQVPLRQLISDDGVQQLRTRLTRKMGSRAVSMCYPLAVNNLVTRCLNKAAELGVPQVTRDVVDEA